MALLCHYAECHDADCHYADCHYADCNYADCHYADCHYAKCRGAIAWDGNNMNCIIDCINTTYNFFDVIIM